MRPNGDSGKLIWISLKSTWKGTNQISKEWMYFSAQKLHMDDLSRALERMFIQSRGRICYVFRRSRWAHGCQATTLSSGVSMTLSYMIIVILQPLKIMLAIKKVMLSLTTLHSCSKGCVWNQCTWIHSSLTTSCRQSHNAICCIDGCEYYCCVKLNQSATVKTTDSLLLLTF